VPEPVPEPVQEIVPEPIPVPAPEPVPEPVQELIPDVIPEPISAPVQAPEPIPAPLVTQPSTEPSTPIVPTLVIDTEPTVRFTDFNQMIREDKHGTEFSYVAHSNEANGEGDDDEDDERMPFLDEDGEPLSDFEDLDAAAAESLSDGDFETL
jgi:hypothetical protein